MPKIKVTPINDTFIPVKFKRTKLFLKNNVLYYPDKKRGWGLIEGTEIYKYGGSIGHLKLLEFI